MTLSATTKPIVLVLDDDAAVLNSLRFLLETHGFAVSTFQNGAAMLDWAGQNAFDCAVIDYKMPGIDGLQVAAELRERGVVAPIVLVTGFPDNAILAKATAIGIRHVLLKPHIEDSLVDRIHEVLPGLPSRLAPPAAVTTSVNVLKA